MRSKKRKRPGNGSRVGAGEELGRVGAFMAARPMSTPIALFEIYWPPGPHPHVHILPCPYDTRPWRANSSYRRGERGEDAGWWALVVARYTSTYQKLHQRP